MNRRTLLIGASALGLAAFAGGAYVLNQRRAAEAEAATAMAPTADLALLVQDYSPSFGPADAPVTGRVLRSVLRGLPRLSPRGARDPAAVPHAGPRRAPLHRLPRRIGRGRAHPRGCADAGQVRAGAGCAAGTATGLGRAWFAAPAGRGRESPGPRGSISRAESDKLFPGITGVLNQDAADVEALAIRQTPTFFLNGRRLENFSADTA